MAGLGFLIAVILPLSRSARNAGLSPVSTLGLVRTGAGCSAVPDLCATGALGFHEPEAREGLGFKNGLGGPTFAAGSKISSANHSAAGRLAGAATRGTAGSSAAFGAGAFAGLAAISTVFGATTGPGAFFSGGGAAAARSAMLRCMA